jgi:hypothetical protein
MEADIETSVADIRLERAINIILLIPMSNSLRFVAIVCLFVAISSIDFLLTSREILEEGDFDP